MAISSYYLAIIIGLCLSLFMEIKLGISPGGMVVPCYLALVFDRPAVLLNIILVALITFLIIKFIVSKYIMIYGKRRFLTCILIALGVKFGLDLLYPGVPFSVFAFSGIGVVAGGILANCYFKQGVLITTGAAVAVSGFTFLLINLILLI